MTTSSGGSSTSSTGAGIGVRFVPDPAFIAYSERLSKRRALERANERNAAVAKEHGLAQH